MPINLSPTPTFFDVSAAADFLGNGAIELPQFQTEILDLARRRGVLGQRLAYQPATGQPTRYFEQTAIPQGGFVDPRNIAGALVTASPTRVERSVNQVAVAGQINFGMFDTEVTRQQGVYTQLMAKDLRDLIAGTLQVEDKALWNGNSSLNALQFNGVITQVTNTGTIAPGVSILDSIRTQIAQMVNNGTYEVRPTAIYMNAVALDYLEKEIKANASTILGTTTIVGGLVVGSLMTAAGVLPIIPDWTLPTGSAGSGYGASYPIVIVSENLLEYHYTTTQFPRVFQLGLITDLATKFVVVKFGTLVVKAGSYAHSVLTLQR